METPQISYKIPHPASDDNLTWDVISVMWEHVNFYEDEETYKQSIEPATKGQLAIYACTWYISEVKNGGHDQFFFNSTGMVWQDALNGFVLLGAEKYCQILSEAIAVFPNSNPAKDRQKRMDQLALVNKALLDDLDNRLYLLGEEFDTDALRYIVGHSTDFFDQT